MQSNYTTTTSNNLTIYRSTIYTQVSVSTNDFNSMVNIEVTFQGKPSKNIYESISKRKPLEDELLRLFNMGVKLL
jgi:hypothetical protein